MFVINIIIREKKIWHHYYNCRKPIVVEVFCDTQADFPLCVPALSSILFASIVEVFLVSLLGKSVPTTWRLPLCRLGLAHFDRILELCRLSVTCLSRRQGR